MVCCSLTSSGALIAGRLPYEHRNGDLIATVAELWSQVDAFVLVAASGIAVRAIAPHLSDKRIDPAVVCIDDSASFVIPLCGGHVAGANGLAREVAATLGATPVITTATDRAALPALDALPGMRADGDLAGVTRAWLDGRVPALQIDEGLESWPLPRDIAALPPDGATRVVVTDRVCREPAPGEVRLRPRSLVIGAGSSSGADADRLWQLARAQLDAFGLDPGAVGLVATIDRKLDEPAIKQLAEHLQVPLRGFESSALARVGVPNPSEAAMRAVGTPSVAEAAALLAAGSRSFLVVSKAVASSRDSTLAIARRRKPEGHLSVVGIGPGHPSKRSSEATAAIRNADVIAGYAGYVDLVSDLIEPRHDVIPSQIGAEEDRCREALKLAADGQNVALVCSGDPGVYAMASLVCELAGDYADPPVTVVPGITAALSGASLLGAPLGHDHAAISLSDLLTPWHVIERRLRAAAEGDFVVSLYNPRSSRRTGQLVEALRILSRHRPSFTPAAVLTDIGRPGETIHRTVLHDLDPESVGMLSLVIVGSSATRWIGERMVTPRGYRTSSP